MKNITKDFIDNSEREYESSDIYAVARHALTNNSISSLTKVNEQTEFTRNRFSIDIKTLKVTNQKASGRCWIFAGCNVLREAVAKKLNLKEFEISQNYVAFFDKLEKCNYLLESVIKLRNDKSEERTLDTILQRGIEDGGQWDLFVNVVKKYGVVPKDAFPETFQSSNTREIDNLLNRYVRKFAYEIKNTDENEIENKKSFVMKNIYKILCSCFGVPPKTFSFEYVVEDKEGNKEYHNEKNLTPHKFLDEYVGINLDEYVSIIHSPTEDKPFNETYTVKYLGNVIEGNQVKYLNLDMNRMKELVINQLKDGETVWFGSDCSKCADRKGGIWDDRSFDIDKLFQIDTSMPKEAMLDTWESAMNHAMVITGVNLDEGKATKWKIENSWGEDVASKGYYVATDSWFDKFVYQAVINKKYLNEYELSNLNKEPKKLELWDPMGTLA